MRTQTTTVLFVAVINPATGHKRLGEFQGTLSLRSGSSCVSEHERLDHHILEVIAEAPHFTTGWTLIYKTESTYRASPPPPPARTTLATKIPPISVSSSSAGMAATVMLNGKPRDLVAHVMETHDGLFHYDLSRDRSDGTRLMLGGADAAIMDNCYGLEDNPVDNKLGIAPLSGKSPAGLGGGAHDPFTEADTVAFTRDLNAELDRTGVKGKVNVKMVRDLFSRARGEPAAARCSAWLDAFALLASTS